MVRLRKASAIILALALILISGSELQAFSITERKNYIAGPYTFTLEVQLYGKGRLLKKNPITVSSLKVKVKNERASSEPLKIKTVRAFYDPAVYSDIETTGFFVAPGNWVTKYYRLRKAKRPTLTEQGFIEITFQDFCLRFNPRDKKFQGPIT